MNAAFGIKDNLLISFQSIVRQRGQRNVFCAGDMVLVIFCFAAQINQAVIGFSFDYPIRKIDRIYMVHFALHDAGEVGCIKSDACPLVWAAGKGRNQTEQANQQTNLRIPVPFLSS